MLLRSGYSGGVRKTAGGIIKVHPEFALGTTSAAIVTATRMEGLMLDIKERTVFSRLTIRQATGGGANTKVGFAIYDCSASASLSAVGGVQVYNSGVLVATGTGLIGPALGTPQSLNAGRYLLAWTTDSAGTFTVTTPGLNAPFASMFYQSSASVATPGTMPSVVPAGIMGTGNCPFFQFQTV